MTSPDLTADLVRIMEVWGIADPEGAEAMLSWSPRYDDLSPEQRAEVIDHFTRVAEEPARPTRT